MGKGPDETAAAELDCAPTYEEVVKAIRGLTKRELAGIILVPRC